MMSLLITLLHNKRTCHVIANHILLRERPWLLNPCAKSRARRLSRYNLMDARFSSLTPTNDETMMNGWKNCRLTICRPIMNLHNSLAVKMQIAIISAECFLNLGKQQLGIMSEVSRLFINRPCYLSFI